MWWRVCPGAGRFDWRRRTAQRSRRSTSSSPSSARITARGCTTGSELLAPDSEDRGEGAQGEQQGAHSGPARAGAIGGAVPVRQGRAGVARYQVAEARRQIRATRLPVAVEGVEGE